MLEAHEITFSFGHTLALRGASLMVYPGEILAVMGPSGSGKSTLLHCLAGILVPDRGEISFAGQRLDTMDEGARSALRRDRFGFVFQFGQLVPELTAQENVALPLLLRGTSRSAAMGEAAAWFGRSVWTDSGDADRRSCPAGKSGVTVIHRNPAVQPEQPGPDGLVLCAQLTRTPAIGKCPRGATVVAIDSTFGNGFGRKITVDQVVWPAAPITPEALAALPVHALVVGTNGSTAAVETARTQLENAVPSRFPPDTLSSMNPDSDRLLAGYKQLANVVILVSLPIAGCSLAVAVAAGLADRRRPFSVLRLTGVPLAMLRRVVALETVVPLVLTAAASIAIGFLAAALFLRAQLDQTLVAPGPQYYLIVALGLVAALAILGSTLPMMSRITGPEAARFD